MQYDDTEVGKAWTLYILGTLAEDWPRRVSFDANILIENTQVHPRGSSDVDETFYGLIDWLENEGLIRFDRKTLGDSWVEDVQITAKAMDAIGHALPTAKGGAGAHLKSIAVGAGSEAGKAAIAETVGLVIGAAVRSFTGAGAS